VAVTEALQVCNQAVTSRHSPGTKAARLWARPLPRRSGNENSWSRARAETPLNAFPADCSGAAIPGQVRVRTPGPS
jgi:hypothetical protein